MARSRVVAADLEALVSGALRVADAAIVIVAAVVSYGFRHGTYALPNLYLMAVMAAVALTVNYMHIARVYQFANLTRLTAQFGLLSMSWTAVMLSLIALAYFTQTSIAFSRAFVLGWFLISFGGSSAGSCWRGSCC
jgi:putative colanic acid biosysnthesis UDP-glucose lipid carrier transferase